MATELKIPEVGESIQEVQIARWHKREGDRVELDEEIVELETDKASVELPASASGVLTKILKHEGERASVGEAVALIDSDGKEQDRDGGKSKEEPTEREEPSDEQRPSPKEAESASRRETEPGPVRAESQRDVPADSEEEEAEELETADESREGEQTIAITPSARRELRKHGLKVEQIPLSGNRLRRKDVVQYVSRHEQETGESEHEPAPAQREEVERDESGETAARDGKGAKEVAEPAAPGKREPEREDSRSAREEVVPMSWIRQRISERLVKAQHQAALLTTFNEIDMSQVQALRQRCREQFQKKHGVKLGLMPFFVRAVVEALRESPELNAEVRETDIVYRRYFDIGIAIGSGKGLVVPVLRGADRLSFADIDRAILDFAQRAQANKLKPDELQGGTFTISNGGVYGSLLSTPIVNPPQSGVLGMHAIEPRPVARDGQVVIRPMMYIALTYDHRIVDGREAVTFLRRVKESIEEPARMLLDI